MGCGVIHSASGMYQPHRIILSKTERGPSRSRRLAGRIRRLTLALALACVGDLGLAMNRPAEVGWDRSRPMPGGAAVAGAIAPAAESVTDRAVRWRAGVRATRGALQSWLTIARSVRTALLATPRHP